MRVLDTYKKLVGSGFLINFLIFEISGTLWSKKRKMHENALKTMNFRNFAPEATKNLENEENFQKSVSYKFFVCVQYARSADHIVRAVPELKVPKVFKS